MQKKFYSRAAHLEVTVTFPDQSRGHAVTMKCGEKKLELVANVREQSDLLCAGNVRARLEVYPRHATILFELEVRANDSCLWLSCRNDGTVPKEVGFDQVPLDFVPEEPAAKES